MFPFDPAPAPCTQRYPFSVTFFDGPCPGLSSTNFLRKDSEMGFNNAVNTMQCPTQTANAVLKSLSSIHSQFVTAKLPDALREILLFTTSPLTNAIKNGLTHARFRVPYDFITLSGQKET